MNDAEAITKKSKSNLAFAFISLPKEKRNDITAFYAFCRKVDDAADDPGIPLSERLVWLKGWRRWLLKPGEGEPVFAGRVREIIDKYRIDRQLFEEILLGVEADLSPVRFKNFKELAEYCFRVASAVGLVSIEIFGYKNPQCRIYADRLGMALQLTNIIRDVDKDLKNEGRIYLPADEIEMFGYSEEALRRREYNYSFVQLMQYQGGRARSFYRDAVRLLPNEDRRAMVAAEGMRAIYSSLLQRIEGDQYRVFEKEYRLTRFEKGMIILAKTASNYLPIR